MFTHLTIIQKKREKKISAHECSSSWTWRWSSSRWRSSQSHSCCLPSQLPVWMKSLCVDLNLFVTYFQFLSFKEPSPCTPTPNPLFLSSSRKVPIVRLYINLPVNSHHWNQHKTQTASFLQVCFIILFYYFILFLKKAKENHYLLCVTGTMLPHSGQEFSKITRFPPSSWGNPQIPNSIDPGQWSPPPPSSPHLYSLIIYIYNFNKNHFNPKVILIATH